MYSLYKLETVWDILLKLVTNLKHHETRCRTHKPYFYLTYFWSSEPLNIEKSDFFNMCPPSEMFSWNFMQMYITIIWCAEHENHTLN